MAKQHLFFLQIFSSSDIFTAIYSQRLVAKAWTKPSLWSISICMISIFLHTHAIYFHYNYILTSLAISPQGFIISFAYEPWDITRVIKYNQHILQNIHHYFGQTLTIWSNCFLVFNEILQKYICVFFMVQSF